MSRSSCDRVGQSSSPMASQEGDFAVAATTVMADVRPFSVADKDQGAIGFSRPAISSSGVTPSSLGRHAPRCAARFLFEDVARGRCARRPQLLGRITCILRADDTAGRNPTVPP
jgi:hypothetical protein